MNTQIARRALFVGIGGGNDVFSALLAASSLKRIGWKWDECAFAGVLSPFHSHRVERTSIGGFYKIDRFSTREVRRNDRTIEIGFVDATVAKIVSGDSDLGSGVYGLSLCEGSRGLSRTFKALSGIYDLIVLVDVGGDCFYGGPRDRHVLSPMFDAMTLRGFVEAGIPGFLFEAGPGTDGELEPEALEESLAACRAEAFPLDPRDVGRWSEIYEGFIAPVRTGNTVPRSLEAFSSSDEILVRPYRVRAHVGDRKLYVTLEQRIKTKLCRSFFLADPKEIKNPFAVECSDPLDWFIKTQIAQARTNCEANLEFLRVGGFLCQFATPSPLFSEADRQALLGMCLKEFRDGSCDFIWLLPEDWERAEAAWSGKLQKVGSKDLVTLARR